MKVDDFGESNQAFMPFRHVMANQFDGLFLWLGNDQYDRTMMANHFRPLQVDNANDLIKLFPARQWTRRYQELIKPFIDAQWCLSSIVRNTFGVVDQNDDFGKMIMFFLSFFLISLFKRFNSLSTITC